MEHATVLFKKFKKNFENPILCYIEKVSKVPKECVVVGVVLIIANSLIFRIGAGFICNLVGFIYPAYWSLKAIESKTRDDDTQWLVYWVFYAAFSIVDSFVEFLLRWIPFYYFFKLGFFLWFFHPSTKGALVVYENVLKKLLSCADETVDEAMRKTKLSEAKPAEDFSKLQSLLTDKLQKVQQDVSAVANEVGQLFGRLADQHGEPVNIEEQVRHHPDMGFQGTQAQAVLEESNNPVEIADAKETALKVQPVNGEEKVHNRLEMEFQETQAGAVPEESNNPFEEAVAKFRAFNLK